MGVRPRKSYGHRQEPPLTAGLARVFGVRSCIEAFLKERSCKRNAEMQDLTLTY